MLFDGDNRVEISVGRIYEAGLDGGTSLQGLCGNYDNDPKNDLTDDEFDRSVYDRISRCIVHPGFPNLFIYLGIGNTEDIFKMCKSFATSRNFEDCRSVVAIEPFYDSCWLLLSLCAFDGTNCQDVCSIYSDFSAACTQHNIPVKWRTKTFCRKFH